jgi:hypothetical protein
MEKEPWYYSRPASCLEDFTEMATEVLSATENLHDVIDAGEPDAFATSAQDLFQIEYASDLVRSDAIPSLSLCAEIAAVCSTVAMWGGRYATSVHALLTEAASFMSDEIRRAVIGAHQAAGHGETFPLVTYDRDGLTVQRHEGSPKERLDERSLARVSLDELVAIGRPLGNCDLAKYFDEVKEELRDLPSFSEDERERLYCELEQENARVKVRRIELGLAPHGEGEPSYRTGAGKKNKNLRNKSAI